MTVRRLARAAALCGLACLAVASPAQAEPSVDRVRLCQVVLGDGTCTPQPNGLFAPGERMWARADLSGFARDGDEVDLELTLEIVSPRGAVVDRGVVLRGRAAVPRQKESVFAVIRRDLGAAAAPGEYLLRLLLNDRLAGRRATASVGFAVGERDKMAMAAPVERQGRNLAVEIRAHGFALAAEVGGRAAPPDRLYLVVETTWRNLLAVETYRVDLELLADLRIDGESGYAPVVLSRHLDGALPGRLDIPPQGAVRGLLAFAVPSRFDSAVLRYRDERIGRGEIVLPLFDAAAGEVLDFPAPAAAEPPEIEPPSGAATPEIEPNDDPGHATPLPAAETLAAAGELAGDSDQDWYELRVETSEAMLWRFELTPPEDGDLWLELKAGPLDRLRVDNGAAGERELLASVALAAGSYHLGVGGRGAAGGGYQLEARLVGAARPDEESEANNRRDAADRLTPGRAVRGRLGFRNDADWYRLTLERDTAVAILLTPPPGLDADLQIHDAGGRQLERWSLGGPGEAERHSVRLAAGEHYLVVRLAALAAADPWNQYSLVAVPLRSEGADRDLEDNDVPARANPLTAGVVLRGTFQRQDEDWYAVDNAAAGERVLKAVLWGGKGLRPRVSVHSLEGAEVGGGGREGTFAYAPVPPGISYVRAAGWHGPYRLLVRLDRPAPVRDPRAAAQLGLDTLLASAVGWQNQHHCFGCHVQGMAVMGGALGAANGYRVHPEELAAMVELMHGQDPADYRYGGGGPRTAMLLNGMALAYHDELVAPADPATRRWLAGTAEALASEQREEGNWTHSWPIVPVHQGDIQATADAVGLLRRAPGEWSRVLRRAVAYLTGAEPGSVQDHAYRVIGLSLAGEADSGEAILDGRAALEAVQNEDGGWSELPELGSSPYATGQALYALKLAGVGPQNPAFDRGVRWLLGTQEWWGGWEPRNSSNRNPTKTSIFPSTMWASIGLAGTLQTVHVEITAPRAGAPVSRQTTVEVDAEAPAGASVAKVELLIDGEPLGGDVEAPFRWSWRPRDLDLAHRLEAIAHDSEGRRGRHVIYTAAAGGEGTLLVTYPPDVSLAATLAAETAVEVILDASGSMLKPLAGRRRIDVAKEVLLELTGQILPEGTRLALRVFGHLEAEACSGRLELPLAPLDRATARSVIEGIEAVNRARTPIAESLRLAASDLEAAEGQRVMVLVTDGDETCGGDPAGQLRALRERGLEVRVDVVGFAVDDPGLRSELEKLAEAGGGRYFEATGAGELGASLQQALATPFRVLGEDGAEVARGAVGVGPVPLPAGSYTVEVAAPLDETHPGVVIRRNRRTLVEVTPRDGPSGESNPGPTD